MISHVQGIASSWRPEIPSLPDVSVGHETILTVGSVDGSSRWRTYVSPVLSGEYRVIVAVPMSPVTNALHRLL